jgi:hypothetical protein
LLWRRHGQTPHQHANHVCTRLCVELGEL